jgi:alpha-mannosidase
MLIGILILKQLRRIRATVNENRELPAVNMGHSVDEYFDYIASKSDAGRKLPNR